jgi:hypothetical protein
VSLPFFSLSPVSLFALAPLKHLCTFVIVQVRGSERELGKCGAGLQRVVKHLGGDSPGSMSEFRPVSEGGRSGDVAKERSNRTEVFFSIPHLALSRENNIECSQNLRRASPCLYVRMWSSGACEHLTFDAPPVLVPCRWNLQVLGPHLPMRTAGPAAREASHAGSRPNPLTAQGK